MGQFGLGVCCGDLCFYVCYFGFEVVSVDVEEWVVFFDELFFFEVYCFDGIGYV